MLDGYSAENWKVLCIVRLAIKEIANEFLL